jgi:hypothetical protein
MTRTDFWSTRRGDLFDESCRRGPLSPLPTSS